MGRAVVWAAGVLLLLLTAAWHIGVRLNLTASLPVGLYLVTQESASRGSIVLACLPLQVATFARQRGYVPRGNGCPGGTAPIGKRILALPGDTVTLTSAGLTVNRAPAPLSRPRALDQSGRPLPSATFGLNVVRPGQVWLASAHPLSFDSRYFGPLAISSVQAVVRPLWMVERPHSLRSLPP